MNQRHNSAIPGLVGCVLIVFFATANAGNPGVPQARLDRIQELILQLGDPDFLVREVAATKLDAIGEPAFDELAAATKASSDTEIRTRAAKLLESIEARREFQCFEDKASSPTSVAFGVNGVDLLVGRTDGSLSSFDIKKKSEIWRCQPQNSGSDQLLVRTSYSDIYTPVRLNLPRAVTTLALSADGNLVFSGGSEPPCLRESKTGRQVRVLPTVGNTIKGAAFSADGESVFIKDTYDLCTFSVSGKEKEASPWLNFVTSSRPRFPGSDCVIAGNGQRVAIMNQKVIEVYEVQTAARLLPLENCPADISCFSLSCDGSELIIGSNDGILCRWSTLTGKVVQEYSIKPDHVRCVAISPDGRQIIGGTESGVICLWDLNRRAERCRFKGHTGIIQCLAFSQDGRFVASGASDRTVRVWKIPQ
jgi:WD40 repeat protein